MNRLVIILVSCLIWIECVQTWTAIDPMGPDAEHCFAPNGDLLNLGDKWHDDYKCIQYACGGTPKNLYTVLTGCGAQYVPDGCVLKESKGRFPECCPQIVCDDE